MVDMFATKLNHKLPIYVSPVPNANAMNIDALNISCMGGSGRLCLFSCSKSHTENEHLQVQDDSSSTRVAQNALVLGSSESVNQAPLQLPHWPHLLKQPFSQKFHQNLMYLNLHVWHLDTTQNHLNHSLSRWQIELRHLKDPI